MQDLPSLADQIAKSDNILEFPDAVLAFFGRRLITRAGVVKIDPDDLEATLANLLGTDSGKGLLMRATGTITNAQVLALRATPKVLVAAPGAGKLIEFVSLTLFNDYATAAWSESADNLAVRYDTTTGVLVSQAIEATGFLDATADTITNGLPKIDAIAAKTAAENKALVLHNTGDGEYGGGNAAHVLRFSVLYRIVPTGF